MALSVFPLANVSALQGMKLQVARGNAFPWPRGSILDAQVRLPAKAGDFIILQIGREQIRVRRPDVPLQEGRVLFEVVRNRGLVELRVIPDARLEGYVQDMIVRVLGDRATRYEGMRSHLETQLARLDDALSVQVYRDMAQDMPYYGLVQVQDGASRGSLAVCCLAPLTFHFRLSFMYMHTLFLSLTRQPTHWSVELFDPSGEFVAVLKQALEEWTVPGKVHVQVQAFLPAWAKVQLRTA